MIIRMQTVLCVLLVVFVPTLITCGEGQSLVVNFQANIDQAQIDHEKQATVMLVKNSLSISIGASKFDKKKSVVAGDYSIALSKELKQDLQEQLKGDSKELYLCLKSDKDNKQYTWVPVENYTRFKRSVLALQPTQKLQRRKSAPALLPGYNFIGAGVGLQFSCSSSFIEEDLSNTESQLFGDDSGEDNKVPKNSVAFSAQLVDDEEVGLQALLIKEDDKLKIQISVDANSIKKIKLSDTVLSQLKEVAQGNPIGTIIVVDSVLRGNEYKALLTLTADVANQLDIEVEPEQKVEKVLQQVDNILDGKKASWWQHSKVTFVGTSAFVLVSIFALVTYFDITFEDVQHISWQGIMKALSERNFLQ